LLTSLANVLSKLATQENGTEDLESPQARLLRTVWYYIALFKFASPGAWRSDWSNAVVEIAKHVPPLTSRKVFVFMQMELELDALIQNGNFHKVS
jgi:hypothetical protein